MKILIFSQEIELESKILNETSIEAVFDPKDVGSFMVDCVIVKDNVSTGVCTQTIFVGCKSLKSLSIHCHPEKLKKFVSHHTANIARKLFLWPSCLH